MRETSSVPALLGLVTDPLSPARLAEMQQRVHQRPNDSDYQLMIKLLDEDCIRNHRLPDRDRYSWLRTGQHTNIFQRALDIQRRDAANLVRLSAIQAITNIAPANLESLLVGLLGSPDTDVGSMASRVLRERGESVRALLIQTAVDTKMPAYGRVRAMETLVPPVASAARNESDRLRKVLLDGEPVEVGIAEEPVAQVVKLPQDVEKLFVTLLADADHKVRLAATIHLGEAGVNEAIEPLLDTFRKCDPSLLESVATAIASFKDDRITPVLTAALGDDRYSATRYAIARTLGIVGDKRATSALLGMAIKNNDVSLQAVAIEALAGIRDPSAEQPLIQWFVQLVDEYESLARTKPPADAAALSALRDSSSRIERLLNKLIGYFGDARVKDAVPVLIPLLASERIGKYGGLATPAMATLAKIGDARAVAPISDLISKGGSYNSRLYVNAVTKGGIDALVVIGDPSGIPILKRLAADWQNPKDPFTGKYAIEAIGRMRHPDAVKVLMDFLTDPQIDTSMHDACVGPALASAGPVARDALLKLLSESPRPKEGAKVDPGMYAAQILGVMEKPEVNVIPPLARILASSPPPYIVQRVTEALAQTRHEAAINSLGEAMKKGDSLTRAQSALALGKTRLRSAIPHLKAGLSDKDTKVAECAATALLEILIEKPDKDSIPDIVRILAIKPPQGIVLRVVDALSQLRQDESVDGLAEIMAKADPFTKGFVAGAMGRMKLPRALPHLRNALSDSSPEVRESAAASLLDIVLERIEPAILPDLANVVASKPSAITIQRATDAMAEMHAESAVRALGDVLKTDDATTRGLAANALGKIRLRSAIPLLKHAQTDADEKVRRAATAALTVYGFGTKSQKKEPST
jgi:HEAT repeat protein